VKSTDHDILLHTKTMPQIHKTFPTPTKHSLE